MKRFIQSLQFKTKWNESILIGNSRKTNQICELIQFVNCNSQSTSTRAHWHKLGFLKMVNKINILAIHLKFWFWKNFIPIFRISNEKSWMNAEKSMTCFQLLAISKLLAYGFQLLVSFLTLPFGGYQLLVPTFSSTESHIWLRETSKYRYNWFIIDTKHLITTWV